MNSELFNALKDERSIFREFNSWRTIGRFEVFHSPNLEEIPHWNLCYPTDNNNPLPSASELKELGGYFSEIGINGHIGTSDARYKGEASEESEYFMLTGEPKMESTWNVDRLRHQAEDLSRFCATIQNCFSLSDETIAYFKTKMELLASRAHSRFFVVQLDNEVLGCCSSFRTDSGADFLFNVATMPAFEGKGVAKSILAYAAIQTSRPLYTYSHNSKMRENILPSVGFRSIGTLFCVPLTRFGNSNEIRE